MMQPVIHNQPQLNQTLPGFFGKFGRGANIEVNYLQTIITKDFLDKLKLIEEIEGSDKWDVRDLFQRNVDNERVSTEILPYFKDNTKVKFFPPLTLVLLPMEEDQAINKIEYLETEEEEVSGYHYNTIGTEDYFKFYISKEGAEYSFVKWNDRKVRVVAVDGQHRLTAFKLWQDAGHSDLLNSMSIPVVILGFSKYDKGGLDTALLDVVRKTFVYINSKAKKINESRRILLDDEDINCVCTQEVVQYAHTNDQQKLTEVDLSKIPLMMFDWRGEEKNGNPVPLPSSIFSVHEIREWMRSYILGDSSDKNNKKAIEKKIIPRLSLDSLMPSFTANDFPLTHANSNTARDYFKEHLLPSIVYVIENLQPFNQYIQNIRALQEDTIRENGVMGEEAFKWVCFGISNANVINRQGVNTLYTQLCGKFSQIKEDNIPRLLTRDIGIRAIWSSFSYLRDEKRDFEKDYNENWHDFSKWYVGLCNQVIQDDLFEDFFDNPNNKNLIHVAFSTDGGIINYKPASVDKGLGSLLSLLILKKNEDQGFLDSVWSNAIEDNISSLVKNGIKKEVKKEMQADFVGNMDQYKVELSKRTTRNLKKWIQQLKEEIGISGDN